MWQQQSKKEISNINKIFREVGLELPEKLSAFTRPSVEIQAQVTGEVKEFINETCETSDKARFLSQSAAEKAAKARKRQGAGFLRVYCCSHCGDFHLTSAKLKK